MNLDAVGLVQMPPWAGTLRDLYWRLRASRALSRPSPRTWSRRIRAEKIRLVESGVPLFEVHMICRVLRCGRGDQVKQWNAERRYIEYMAGRQRAQFK